MKCPKCKMEIPDGAEICPYCRSRLIKYKILQPIPKL